jgi:RND superfamily putative drug exporter
MAGLARWCFRHRLLVLAFWVVAFAGLSIVNTTVGSAYSNSFSLPGTESTKALDLIEASFSTQAGDQDTIVIHTSTGSVTDAAVKPEVVAMLAKVAKIPQVGAVASPYTPQGASQISRDGRTAFATITFTKLAQQLDSANIQAVINDGSALRSSTLQVEFGGNAIEGRNAVTTSSSEAIGLIAAAVILFVAFGSLLSMIVPLLAAIFALGTAIESIGLLSHTFGINMIAPTIAALVGLGVGIDYALFIVTRYRTGLRSGLPPEEAAVTALNTSGRAVTFAGGTVVIAMLGLLVCRVSFLNGIGVAAAVMVFFAVAAALTLLPALFGLLGSRVLSRKQRRQLTTEGPVGADLQSGAWSRWAGWVSKRPAVLAAIAAVVMIVIAIPALSIRLGSSDAGNDPAASTTRKAYDLLADGFGPGYNGPLQLVAKTPTTADVTAFTHLVTTLKTQPGVASIAAAPAAPGAAVRIAILTPTTSPQSVQTSNLIDTLRGTIIPAQERGTSLVVYVGGATAIYKDFAGVLTSKLPLFLGVIIALGFLLLVLAFRSIVIPATAAVMNVISAGAGFGVVVAVFQYGWGSESLGLGKAGPVEAFLPVMLLAILFGLSMDYQVFLVSRMHEEWMHTGDNGRAVRVGQAATGRVITAAAAIMVFVFLAFVLGGQRVIAEFGFGLASAILLDALVIRTLLVPALMHLFGRANWWLPGWLDRILPHLSVEPAEPALVPAHASAVGSGPGVPASVAAYTGGAHLARNLPGAAGSGEGDSRPAAETDKESVPLR